MATLNLQKERIYIVVFYVYNLWLLYICKKSTKSYSMFTSYGYFVLEKMSNLQSSILSLQSMAILYLQKNSHGMPHSTAYI